MRGMRIAHLSDIHFGRISHPGIVEDIVKDVNDAGVDVVAISGDVTQRAVHRQFKDCVNMLEKFVSPVLVVPGNHDVYPWWRPIARLSRPLHMFKKYLGREMVRSFEADGVAILGINSAHGRTIKGGMISPNISRQVVSYFESRDEGDFKVLMLHHHLKQIQALMPHDVIQEAEKHLNLAFQCGVNLVLCGHIHISHVESLDSDRQTPFVIASAGTATSSRGRRSNRRKNYYNLIDVNDSYFSIEERNYYSEERCFKPMRTTKFERT